MLLEQPEILPLLKDNHDQTALDIGNFLSNSFNKCFSIGEQKVQSRKV